MFLCPIAYNQWCWHQGGHIFFRVLSIVSLLWCVRNVGPSWDAEMPERLTQPSQTHADHTDHYWLAPRHATVRTLNRLIEAIKPQMQRALLKPLLPAATDLQPSFFFPFVLFVSPYTHCFLIHTSVPPPQHAYPSTVFLILLSCYEFDALPMGKHRG